MVIKVRPEDLSQEVKKQLEEFSTSLTRSLNKKLEEVANYTVKSLKQGGPYEERSGNYSKDWAWRSTKNYTPGIMTEELSVYNRKNYQLTHLLEKGHLSRSGKRVQAYEHIKPAEELARQMVISKVNEAVREAAGTGE